MLTADWKSNCVNPMLLKGWVSFSVCLYKSVKHNIFKQKDFKWQGLHLETRHTSGLQHYIFGLQSFFIHW